MARAVRTGGAVPKFVLDARRGVWGDMLQNLVRRSERAGRKRPRAVHESEVMKRRRVSRGYGEVGGRQAEEESTI